MAVCSVPRPVPHGPDSYLAPAPGAARAATLAKTALGHARMRDRWMRRARERRAVPFLTDEVARCAHLARVENRALIQTLRLLVTPRT